MNIALVIIGDEILSGRVNDQNIKSCAEILKSVGLNFSKVSIIKDSFQEIKDELESLSSHNNLVITSGGLGPTLDDKTKEALSFFLGTKIKHNINALKISKINYARKKLEFNKILSSYDQIPKDVTPLDNPKGLAPGLFCKYKDSYIACAPGVPIEFKFMLKDIIIPYYIEQTNLKLNKIESFCIRTMGLPEEKIFGVIDTTLWEKLSVFGNVSSLPMINGVDIIIYLDKEISLNEAQLKIKKIMDNSPLRSYIWHYGNEEISLAQTIINQMIKRNLTVSTAESCTGGLVASKLTDISGASKVLRGGFVTYSNESKITLLGVKEQTIKTYGVISQEVAKEMCEQTCIKNNTDYALSLTGLAGSESFDAHPAGSVYIGIKTPKKTTVHHFILNGDRLKLKERFATKALMLLNSELSKETIL